MSEHDETVGGIVRRNSDAHAVTDHDTNVETAHFTAQFCVDYDGVVQLHFINATS